MLFNRHTLHFKWYALPFLFIFLYACSGESEKQQQNSVWIPGWQLTGQMTIARAGAAVVAYKNHVYILGGVDGVNFLSSVEMSEVRSDGTLATWRVISDMPEARGFISAVVHNERVYVIGGGNGAYGKNLLSSIVSAPLLEDGLLGEWRVEKQTMLIPRRCSKVIVRGNELIALGGFGGALLDSVEMTTFKSNGELDEWRMLENRLTLPRYVNEVKKIGNRIFVLGGHHASKGVGIAQVEFAFLNDHTLKWRESTSMMQGRYAFSSVEYGNNLYAMGGISGSEYLNSIERLTINAENKTENWQQTTNLPEFMANFTTILVGDRVYVFGGSTRHRYMINVWFATINEQGDIGFFGSQKQKDEHTKKHEQTLNAQTLPNKAIVLQLIETDSYTYILVDNKERQIWLAAPNVALGVGDKIAYSEGVFMSNFFSKSLQKKFESILFVGTVKKIQKKD